MKCQFVDALTLTFQHLAAIDRVDISVAEYAREHGLSAPSLYGWRARLRDVSASERHVRFSEVVVTPSVVSAGVRVRVRVRVGEAMLEFTGA